MARFTGDDSEVTIMPGYTLRAPGLIGDADEATAATGLRADGAPPDALDLAAARAGVSIDAALAIRIEDELPTVATRRGTPDDVIELNVPDLGAGMAALHVDENGVYQWLLPERRPSGAAMRGQQVTFLLPRATIQTPSTADRRGLTGLIGKRLVRILTWATHELIGKAAREIVGSWERKNRPHQLVQLDANTIEEGIPRSQTPDWDKLTRGPILLLIHGTFSRWETGFARLPAATWSHLATTYEGRILAFNHPTLHLTPAENVEWLLSQLPRTDLKIDIITHSRGGLIGRHFAERIHTYPQPRPSVLVKKGLLVASPNRGTVLADADRDLETIDRYTNLISKLPSNIATDTLEYLLIGLKVIGYGTLKGLPGLQAMNPKTREDYESQNTPKPTTTYTVIAANWTGHAPGLLERLGKTIGNRVVDSHFDEDNDFVVPTEGAYKTRPDTVLFAPIQKWLFTRKEDDVHHMNYFAHPNTSEWIIQWAKSD